MEQLLQTFSDNWTWLNAAMMAIGACVVWLVARWKSFTEIKVLQSELATRSVSLFEKLIALDEKQRKIVHQLNGSLRQMLEAANCKDATTARQHREETVNTFLLEYVGSYFHLTGLGKWVYHDNKAELVDDEVIPFLETSAQLIQQLNHPDLLQLTGSKPLRVQDFDFQFAIRLARRHIPFWRWQQRRELERTVKMIIG